MIRNGSIKASEQIMSKKISIYNTAEKVIITILLIVVGVVLGLARNGCLPYPWLKGLCGVALAGICLFSFWKVRKKSGDEGE